MGSLPPRVQADPEFPIVLVEDEGSLMCSTHGHVIELPAVPKVIAMIERLNAGEPRMVAGLVAGAVGPGIVQGTTFDIGPSDVESVLQNLLAMRAIREAS